MLLTSPPSKLLLKLPNTKLSWSRCRYLHLFCQHLCASKGGVFDIAHEDNEFNEDRFIIQPDIPVAVSRTIKDIKAKQHSFLEGNTIRIPKLRNHFLLKKYPDIGQPTPCSHPHLFEKENEATPGIKHEEYALRRHSLMRVLCQTNYGRKFDNHVAILAANSVKNMSNDIPYPFHQDTDFLYLSGLNEPDALLVLEYNKTTDRTSFLLFVKPKDPKRELWDGATAGESAAVAYFKADEAFPLSSFHSIVNQRYGRGKYCVWYKKTDKRNARNDSAILDVINSTNFHKAGEHAIEYNLQLLRLIKSDAEVRIMKKSASIASQAFVKVMRNTQVGMFESQLHALLEFECKNNGAQYLSFPPVVAGGFHANTLHYVNNTDILRNRELVLMDGGCEYNGYASDITRTWPINGEFTTPQKILYQIVLDVQNICLKACKPGVSLEHLYHLMLISLGRHLHELGLIRGNNSENYLGKSATEFCPHHLGHYLGMDTHDTPLLHRGLSLQPGMAITLEPGIYIPETATHIPKEYRGIGIRIEDDVLITKNGPYVLTGELPKEINDIEELLRDRVKN